VGTLAVWAFDLDRAIARAFHDPTQEQDWPLGDMAWARFLYRWGEVPAVFLGMAACLMIAWAARRRPRRALERAGVMLLLALMLGPLLLTNGVLKSYYGRPRPQQVVEFGGDQPFRPVLLPTFDPKENSFPSGHAAAGFALLLPYFFLRRGSPGWAYAVLGTGLAFGGVMGMVRMAQGGHFFSDVLWSAGVVYFSGFAVAHGLEPQEARDEHWTTRKVLLVRGAALAVCALIGLVYLARLPFQQTHEWVVPLESGVRRADIEFVTRNGTARVEQIPEGRELRVMMTAQGRGLPIDPVKEMETVLEPSAGDPRVRYTFLPTWSTINFSSRIVVRAPPGVQLTIRQPQGDPRTFVMPEQEPEAAPSD
jgi:membrane-associated PAP2 superfamily phosphatase